jgi:ATP-dependent DNA ligase
LPPSTGKTAAHIASLCAFDLLELDGKDLRDWPLEQRKDALKMLLRKSHPGIAFNRYFDVEALSSSTTPASLAAKASCRNGSDQNIAVADRLTGSK